MIALRRYYESDEDFQQIHQTLQLTQCPCCRQVGTLILHGPIKGFAQSSVREIKRGHRILCNDRRKRHCGCGHTFSLLQAGFLRGFVLSALTLWRFLLAIVSGTPPARAWREINPHQHSTGACGTLRRIRQAQSRIRTFLTRHSAAPAPPADSNPLAAPLAHLVCTFPDAACPVIAFQQRFQASFLLPGRRSRRRRRKTSEPHLTRVAARENFLKEVPPHPLKNF